MLWIVLGFIAALGMAMIALRHAQRRIPPLQLAPGETMPQTALQRLAQRTLVLVALPALAAGAIVVTYGASAFWSDASVRLTATGLLLAALAVFAAGMSRISRWTAKDDGTLDERDQAILRSAPAGQAPAMLATLAVWMIALTETFGATQLVPSVFLYLVFWSCVMVSVLALLTGVVSGYRRQ